MDPEQHLLKNHLMEVSEQTVLLHAMLGWESVRMISKVIISVHMPSSILALIGLSKQVSG